MLEMRENKLVKRIESIFSFVAQVDIYAKTLTLLRQILAIDYINNINFVKISINRTYFKKNIRLNHKLI